MARTYRLRPLAELDLRSGDHRLRAALDPELLQDRRDVRLDGRFGDAEFVGNLFIEQASDSIISTRTCWGVNDVSRVNKSAVSASEPAPRSMSGGVQTPPSNTRLIAPRMASMPSVLGMKPKAPKSMHRRMTPGSSLAETTTIGTLGYWARRYIRPENPRTPGIVKTSRMRSTSPPRSSSFATSSKDPASAISTSSNRPETASRKAPRNSGWSSAMIKRTDSSSRFISRATFVLGPARRQRR